MSYSEHLRNAQDIMSKTGSTQSPEDQLREHRKVLAVVLTELARLGQKVDELSNNKK